MFLRPLKRFFANAAVAKKQKITPPVAQEQQGPKHGRLYTWGPTYYGKLSGSVANSNVSVDTPLLLDEINNVSRVATGQSHVLVQTSENRLYGLGLNSSKQIGDGKSKDIVDFPVQVLNGENVVDFAAGKSHSVVVLQNGNVLMTGNLGWFKTLNGYSNTGLFTEIPALANKNIVQVTAGKHHTLALSKDHHVYGWGSAAKGALPESTDVPYLLENIDYYQHKKHTHAVKVKAVGTSNIVLFDNGKAFAFGEQFFGNLGVRSNELVQETFVYHDLTPVVTDNLQGEEIVDFDLSENASVFLTHSNRAYYSGLGVASKPTPFPVQPGNIKKVFATSTAVGYVTTDNKIYYYVDQIIQDSDKCPKSLMFLSEDPNLQGNIVDIGGAYSLRYAIIG